MSEQEVRQQNVAVVHSFLDLLEAKDIDSWSELWAEDGRQEMPFAPKGFPSRVEGKAALHKHYSGLPTSYGRMAFVDRTVHEMFDPAWVAIEYCGLVDVLATGKPYNNTYLGLFKIGGGKIELFREYFDPTVLVEALGGQEVLLATFNLSAQDG